MSHSFLGCRGYTKQLLKAGSLVEDKPGFKSNSLYSCGLGLVTFWTSGSSVQCELWQHKPHSVAE